MFDWLKRRQEERRRAAEAELEACAPKRPATPFQDMIAGSGQRILHKERMEKLTAKAEEYRRQGRRVPDTSVIEARLYAWEDQQRKDRDAREARELSGCGADSGPEF